MSTLINPAGILARNTKVSLQYHGWQAQNLPCDLYCSPHQYGSGFDQRSAHSNLLPANLSGANLSGIILPSPEGRLSGQPNVNPCRNDGSVYNNIPKYPSCDLPLHGRIAHQSGAVLIISLIMLLLLMLIGTTSMQSTSLEEKMAGNMRDKNLAFQVAESALKAAEASLAVLPIFSNAGTDGFYSETPTPDLSETKIVKDSFWTANPVATSTVTGLGNGIATPKYIIQKMGVADCPGAAVGTLGCTNFRITTRATGGSTNAVVILESIYSR